MCQFICHSICNVMPYFILYYSFIITSYYIIHLFLKNLYWWGLHCFSRPGQSMPRPDHGLVGFTTLAWPVDLAMVRLDLPPWLGLSAWPWFGWFYHPGLACWPGHGLVGFATWPGLLACPCFGWFYLPDLAWPWFDWICHPGQACRPGHGLVGFATLARPVGLAIVWLVLPPWPGLSAWPGVTRPANLVCGL